jgi:hypothetical protein
VGIPLTCACVADQTSAVVLLHHDVKT